MYISFSCQLKSGWKNKMPFIYSSKYWPLWSLTKHTKPLTSNNLLQGAFGRLDPTGSWTEKLYDVLPVGRLGEIPEIANLATYMVSDYSSWMTGEVRK